MNSWVSTGPGQSVEWNDISQGRQADCGPRFVKEAAGSVLGNQVYDRVEALAIGSLHLFGLGRHNPEWDQSAACIRQKSAGFSFGY